MHGTERTAYKILIGSTVQVRDLDVNSRMILQQVSRDSGGRHSLKTEKTPGVP